MATFAHTCAGCGKQLAIPDRYVGRDLKCPACGAPFRVAPPEPEPPPPPPPVASTEEPFPSALESATEALRSRDAGAGAAADTPSLPEVSDGGAVYWRLRRIGVLSAALVSALFNAVLGLGVALVFLLAPGFLARLAPALNVPLRGGVTVVVFPLAYGAIGFVGGALGAALYNLAARFTGGLKIHLE
ncbi:MAG: hypothetical protein ACOY3Y_16160 [Acidobacteriota bacterium]